MLKNESSDSEQHTQFLVSAGATNGFAATPKKPLAHLFFFFFHFQHSTKSTPNNTNAEVQLMSLLAQKDKMWHSKIINPLSSFFAILVQNYQALALWVIH